MRRRLLQGYRAVPAREAAARLDIPGVVVLDVRTPAEFTTGHLPGAINVDVHDPDFDARAARLGPGSPVLLYCRSGSRSVAAGRKLVRLGFSDLVDVKGGIIAWHAAGLPMA